MIFQFVANACGILTGSSGTRILFDPWFSEGAFEGSWFHVEEIISESQLPEIDAIYISHIHPDHFDPIYLSTLSKEIDIIIVDNHPNFLKKALLRLGFDRIITLPQHREVVYREFTLIGFGPFSRSHYSDAIVGNIIDTALYLRSGGISCLNLNDNNLTEEAARHVNELVGKIDLVLLPYGSAGAYPSCFSNLSHEVKLSEKNRIISRNLTHAANLLRLMQPRSALPFAGAYVLGGKQCHKNQYLASPSWEEAADFFRAQPALADVNVVTLRSGGAFNLITSQVEPSHNPPRGTAGSIGVGPLTSITKMYPHENDPPVSVSSLVDCLETAVIEMHRRWDQFGIRNESLVALRLEGQDIGINPVFKKDLNIQAEPSYLLCELDARLLWRILNRQAHWNNAEIGCHIDFYRRGLDYDPDLHVGLQFLHL